MRLSIEECFAVGSDAELLVDEAVSAVGKLKAGLSSLVGLEVLLGFAGLEIEDFNFVAHEKLNDVAKNNLIALVWVKDIQEGVNFFIKFTFCLLIFSLVEEFYIHYVHFGVEFNKFIICDDSVAVFINFFEQIHKLSQESDVLAQLIVQDDVDKVMACHFRSLADYCAVGL